MQATSNDTAMRLGTAGVGAVAGLALWALIEAGFQDLLGFNAYVLVASAVFGFFVLLLGLVGPLKLREALSVSAALGIGASLLLFWSSFRYPSPNDFDYEPFAFAAILFIGAPFGAGLIRKRALDYGFLFETAWGIVVRYIAAWIFVGVFWFALFLSNALLEIVGITLIWDLVEIDWVSYTLSGAVLGLALAVVYELRDYVSPYLPVRLLRLLLPPLTVVVTVFLLALPLRGMSGLFGEFSAATTLMAVAIVAATLVTAAIDSTDADAVQSAFMRLVARILSGFLLLLGILSVWAVWVRVADYGWTPERLVAMITALFVFGYGALYAMGLWRKNWMTRLRQANVYKAIAILIVSALWLTPLLDANRMAANSQLNRFLEGRSELKDLPVWELENVWGFAGRDAIVQLNALDETEYPGLKDMLERAKTESRYVFGRDPVRRSEATLAETVLNAAVIHEIDTELNAEMLSNLPRYRLEQLANQCESHGCVLFVGSLGFGGSSEIWTFKKFDRRVELEIFDQANGGSWQSRGRISSTDLETYERLLEGDFSIAPSSRQSIWVGGLEVTPRRQGDAFVVRP